MSFSKENPHFPEGGFKISEVKYFFFADTIFIIQFQFLIFD